MKNNCDCWIGILHDYNQSPENYLYLSDYIKKIPTPISIYLDKRRGYMTFFNFCPLCGKKINWKQLKLNNK